MSQQLARLRLERIVTTRRDGRLIYYTITDPSLTALVSVLYDMYCGPKAADGAPATD
ncbi:putative HTH-type transcriptional regulator YgaV [compost metagenome]